jgi:hypothetical protein
LGILGASALLNLTKPKQMSIQSIKIKIGNETKELTIKEAKALKDALDELFPQRMPQWLPPAHIETRPLPIPQWIPPNPHVDPLKPYCTISQTGAGATAQ